MKKLAALLACVLCLTLVASLALAETVKIAVVYSDTVDDKGWCQTMHEGMEKAKTMGYDIDYTPVESVQVPDAAATLEQLVGDYDIIIVHGTQFSNACTEVASEYPEQVFANGTSGSVLGENIFTYMPMSEEPGYINGVIAGLTTKVNKVGIVGSADGGDSARYVRGFILGLKAVNPDCEYMLSWTGSFSATVEAGTNAETFIAAGCDVLVGPAQQAVGALRAVNSAEGVLWAAQTLSQMTDFPEVTMAAADYDYSALIVELINRTANGEKGGVSIPLNYYNGGFTFDFSANAELMPEDVKAQAQAALDAFKAAPDTIDITTVTLD